MCRWNGAWFDERIKTLDAESCTSESKVGLRRCDKRKRLSKECGLHRNGIEVQIDVDVDGLSKVVGTYKFAPFNQSERIWSIISTEYSFITIAITVTIMRNFFVPHPLIE
jgi:hypothetical protein